MCRLVHSFPLEDNIRGVICKHVLCVMGRGNGGAHQGTPIMLLFTRVLKNRKNSDSDCRSQTNSGTCACIEICKCVATHDKCLDDINGILPTMTILKVC